MGVIWKVTKNKTLNLRIDLEVAGKVKELEYNGAEDAKSLIMNFKKKLNEIPQTNTYSADCLFVMKEITETFVEVWKLKPNGDFKYKMFSLEKSLGNYNPFVF